MIYLIDGDDRQKAESKAKDFLGENYEVVDAESLEKADLVSIFQGTTLFSETRKILIKDLGAKKELFAELPKYLETEHRIVILEQKIDKRNAVYKELAAVAKKNPQLVKIDEFKILEEVDKFLTFRVFDIALTDGKRAVKLLREAEENNSPYLTVGSWKAVDLLAARPNGEREKRIVKKLAEIDMMLKQTSFSKEPWLLLETFLLELSDKK